MTKGHSAPNFSHLEQRNAMVLLMMHRFIYLYIFYIFYMYIKCWCQCQWWHMTKKRDVRPKFNHLVLTNAVITLTVSSALCDVSASTNGIIWPKMWCCTSFQLSWPNKCNDAIYVWYHWLHVMQHWYQSITWPKMLCCTSFCLSQDNKCNCAIDSAVSITWCQCQH